MTVWTWSSTALTNGSADPTVNLIENMPPPAFNDSMRAMMAGLAKYAADMGGMATVSYPYFGADPNGAAYVGTSNQNFQVLGPISAFNDHQTVAIVPDFQSANAPTINIDAVSIASLKNSPGNAVIEGQLLPSVPYLIRYKTSDGFFYLENPPADLDQNVPVGAVLLYAGTLLPSAKFAFCNSATVLDPTIYATLFALIGYNYGIGTLPGTETSGFMLPNLEGLTIIGERTSSGPIPRSLTTTTGSATTAGTVNSWTIVIPYIMRII